MSRFFRHPILALGLLAMWLLLNDSLEPAHILLGLVIGVIGSATYARLEPPHGKLGRWMVPGAQLVWLVVIDIFRSNAAVLRIALRPATKQRVEGFLTIPLEMRDPRGLAVLAAIVTATPGTAWAHYEAAANVLTLHVLDLVDKDAWVRQFKDKYESRLMEIFP
jgi:multicomponent K+:H+ antiporter subunit E